MQAQRRPAEPDLGVIDSVVAFQAGRGDDVGGWRLREPLGSGGTARVWLAVDGAGRAAALKIASTRFAELLRHEHSLLADLRHPNVVETLGIASSQSGVALALEYLPGGDLVALAGGPPRHWLFALRGVLAALRELHARGVAHCDVKARNVLFAADGSPRLVDFATARPLDDLLRRSIATAACTPAGTSSSARAADCFAFAALLYELITGRLPYALHGPRWPGEAPHASEVSAGAGAAALLARAERVLQASGHVAEGLSVFTDDIESALQACR